jgi:outer membrane protein OmpA-like peptidoglycan-associated protein
MSSSPAAALADGCSVLRTRFETAQKGEDLAGMKAVAGAVVTAADCDEAFRGWARLTVARELTRKARSSVVDGADLAGQAGLLEEALGFGPVWQAAAWLGDAAYDGGRFAEAARRYQEALAHIADEQATPQPPPEPVIEHVFRRAELARLAADQYVAPPTTRAGQPSGLSSASIRGFKPKKVAVPIEFQFNSTVLTPRGAEAAQDLLTSLKAAGNAPVTLVGHTDPVGSPAANQTLSERRAVAVRDFLLANGFGGTVAVEGRGKSDPLKIDEPERFTKDQFYQILRRVAIIQ